MTIRNLQTSLGVFTLDAFNGPVADQWKGAIAVSGINTVDVTRGVEAHMAVKDEESLTRGSLPNNLCSNIYHCFNNMFADP